MSLNNSIEKIKSIDGTSHYINAKYLGGNTIQDITDKVNANKNELLDKINANTVAISNKADSSDIPSLDGYAKLSDIPSLDGYAKSSDIPFKTSQLINDSDFANKTIVDLSLADKADKSEISMFRNNIEGKYYSVSQADTIDKELYYGNYAISGPISSETPYTYTTSSVIPEAFLSNLIKLEFKINDAQLLSYSYLANDAGTNLIFSNYIDFYYYSKIKKVKQIKNKYFTFKYYINAEPIIISDIDAVGLDGDDETGVENFDNEGNIIEVKDVFNSNIKTTSGVNANAKGIQSIATNVGTSIGFLSSASNSGLSVGEYSSAEGMLVLSTKAGKYYNTLNTGLTNNPHGLNGSYGLASHTEGGLTITTQSGMFGHSEGHSTVSDNFAAHAEGRKTYSGGLSSHAEGSGSIALGYGSHTEGISSKEYHELFADGKNGGLSIDEIIAKWDDNKFSMASGEGSHVEGTDCLAMGDNSHAEGCINKVSGFASHAEGSENVASGKYSHCEGFLTVASGDCSHAEGQGSTASGMMSHAEGKTSIASGEYSHAGGIESQATEYGAFAHGYKANASGRCSLAIGTQVYASGTHSMATGKNNRSGGVYSYAGGEDTIANGGRGIAYGKYLETNNDSESAFGKYNKSTKSDIDAEKTRFSVGIGGKESTRKNAMEIKADGNTIFSNAVTATSFNQPSDERLKIFKSDINIDLDKLAELRKSYFIFIEDPYTNHLGVSAQEIKEIYPEIVTEGSDGLLRVDYSKLSVIALKAIDILYNKNKELEDRLEKIEKMLNL